MANEPERPIEKLLRDCARKRREEARDASGFELHPATRRLLQGEVARRFARRGGAGKGASGRWLARFLPRLVEACVLVALVAVVVSLWVPGLRKPKGEATLAKSEASAPVSQFAKSVAVPTAPAPAVADKELQPLADRALVASADALALKKASPALEQQSNRLGVDKDSQSAVGESLTMEARRAPAITVAEDSLKLREAGKQISAAPATPPPGAAMALPIEQPATLATSPVTAAASAPAALPAGAPAAGGTSLAFAERRQADNVSSGLAGSGGAVSLAYKGLNGPVASTPPALFGQLGDRINGRDAFNPAVTPTDAHAVLAGNYADAAKKPEGFTASQHFAQVPPVSKAKAALGSVAAPPVLASFQVTQSGRELRVIDSDGSVYTGFLQGAEAPTRTRSFYGMASGGAKAGKAPAREESVVAADTPSPATPVRFFRVTGTNRTLGQAVVFSGNVTGLTNATVSGKLQSVAPGQADASQVSPGRPVFGPLLDSRISGKVVIGRGKPIEIHAVPAP